MVPTMDGKSACEKENDHIEPSPNPNVTKKTSTAAMKKTTTRELSKGTEVFGRNSAKINAMKEKIKRPSEVRLEQYGQLLSPTAKLRGAARGGVSSPTNVNNKCREYKIPASPVDSQKENTPDTQGKSTKHPVTTTFAKNVSGKVSKTDPKLVRTDEDGREFCKRDLLRDFSTAILPILKTIGFRRLSGLYKHKDIEKPLESFSIGKYLCAHGIPGAEELNQEDRFHVENFVKFANVPESYKSSESENLEILSDEKIMTNLKHLGFVFRAERTGPHIILAPGASELLGLGTELPTTFKEGFHFFRSMSQVRVYVRSREILSVDDPSTKRPSKQQGGSSAERSQDQLKVRLWGATSHQPLPSFEASTTFHNLPGMFKEVSTSTPQFRTVTGQQLPEGQKAAKERESAETEFNSGSINAQGGGKQSTGVGSYENKVVSVEHPQKKLPASAGDASATKKKKTVTGTQNTNIAASPAIEMNDDVLAQVKELSLGDLEDDAGARDSYHNLRLDIAIQRKLRNAARASIGLGPIQEPPIPEQFQGDISTENKRLQRILDRVRLEIQLIEEM